MPLFDYDDPDGDARGKSKSKKKKAVENVNPDAWPNCASGLHRLCAREVIENGTLRTLRCGCVCHANGARV